MSTSSSSDSTCRSDRRNALALSILQHRPTDGLTVAMAIAALKGVSLENLMGIEEVERDVVQG